MKELLHALDPLGTMILQTSVLTAVLDDTRLLSYLREPVRDGMYREQKWLAGKLTLQADDLSIPKRHNESNKRQRAHP